MTSNVSDLVIKLRTASPATSTVELINRCRDAAEIIATLTPAEQPEQCFSVKEGYDVDSYQGRGASLTKCPLSEALSIRSVEDVRREAIREALMWKLTKVGHPADNPAIIALVDKELNEMIDTPAPSTDKAEPSPEPFQGRVKPWMDACFGSVISNDRLERGDRLLEEVFELLQSGDYPAERVDALRDYVWNRDKGEPHQEVGGVMVTLAAYCLAHDLDMHEAGDKELSRVWTKVETIRAKQAAKPTGSALPVASPPYNTPTVAEAELTELLDRVEIHERNLNNGFPFTNEMGLDMQNLVFAVRRALAAQTGGE